MPSINASCSTSWASTSSSSTSLRSSPLLASGHSVAKNLGHREPRLNVNKRIHLVLTHRRRLRTSNVFEENRTFSAAAPGRVFPAPFSARLSARFRPIHGPFRPHFRTIYGLFGPYVADRTFLAEYLRVRRHLKPTPSPSSLSVKLPTQAKYFGPKFWPHNLVNTLVNISLGRRQSSSD